MCHICLHIDISVSKLRTRYLYNVIFWFPHCVSNSNNMDFSNFKKKLQRLEYTQLLHRRLPWFALCLSRCWLSKVRAYKLVLTNFTENHIVYDGHRSWFHSVRWCQTCLIFWVDFKMHWVFICHATPSHEWKFLCEFVVFGVTWTSSSVWFSII